MEAPVDLLRFIFTTLDRLHLPYIVGGSFASSVFGNRRSTNDLDLVIQVSEFDVDDFVQAFSAHFHVTADEINEALESREPYAGFQMLDPESLFKVDVFVFSGDPLIVSEFENARRVEIVPGIESPVASPENIVLRKILWFQLGGKVSDRQWNDIVGVLEIQKGRLDENYLNDWADRLKIRDMLDDARSQTID